MILLDTQALVWLVTGNERLGVVARSMIEDEGDRRVAAMVSWELAMLVDKRRLSFEMPLDNWIDRALGTNDIAEVAITGRIARHAGSLAGDIHGDPCDRIMIATALHLDCRLVTSDAKILAYAAAGGVKAIDARI